MRKFNELGLELCKMQATIFAQSKSKIEGSSYLFIKQYMNSEVCEKLDQLTYVYENNDLINELDVKNKGNYKLSEDVLYWIGYVYRYWAYTYELSSKKIYKIVPGKEMASLYEPYHTMDPSAAIERIYEFKNIQKPLSQLEILRINYKKYRK